jgi:sugar phosphate isomerase/epimerase
MLHNKRSYSIGMQLWTVRDDWTRDPIATLKRCADLGLDGVELYGDLPLPAHDLRQALDALGLRVAAAHVGDQLEMDFVKRMDEAKILGHNHLVWSFPEASFKETETTLALARAATLRSEALAAQGFRMSLHNHDWEYAGPDQGGRYLDLCHTIGLEFDLYWLHVAGLNPEAMVQRYASRISMLHAKDGPGYRGVPMLPLGQGQVAVKACIAAALAAGAPLEWVHIELDEYDGDIWQAVTMSKSWLDSLA